MSATWSALKTEIADWLNRDDLTSQIPTFIGFAEERFNRNLRVPEMEESVTASSSSATITLPSNFLQMRSLYISATPKVRLHQMGIADLRATYDDATTDEPKHFALQSGTEIVFGPSPDASYTYIMNYYEKIPTLGSGQSDNWLLLAHSDLYLNASLAEAMVFLRDADGLAIFEGRTQQKIKELNDLARRKERSMDRPKLRTEASLMQGWSYDITRDV